MPSDAKPRQSKSQMVHIQCPGEPGTLCDPETPSERLGTHSELRDSPADACWVCIDIYVEASHL